MAFVIALVWALVTLGGVATARADMNDPLESRLTADLVEALFPGADGIGPVAGEPPVAPVLAGGETIGYLFSTHETVRPSGFSGGSFDIVIGLDANGIVVGHRTLEQHEPMVADTIVPMANIDKILSRRHDSPVRGMHRLAPRKTDGVSGATVSAKAMANAFTAAATKAAYLTGIVDDAAGGVSVERYGFESRTWSDLVADGSVRQKVLTFGEVRDAFAERLGAAAEPDIAMGGADETFLTLYAALATPPTVGANLIGEQAYRLMTQKSQAGAQHIVVASAGGLDWLPSAAWMVATVTDIAIVQNGRAMPLRPVDVEPLKGLAAEGAPPVDAVARFSLPARLDFKATEPWGVQVRLKEKTTADNDRRRVDFDMPYRVPAAYVEGSDYALEEAGFKAPTYVGFGLLRESTMTDWQATWVEKRWDLIALVALLAAVSAAVIWQSWISRSERRRVIIRYGLLSVTLVWLGWIAGGQLTIVSVINYARVFVTGLDWTTVLFDPLLLILSVYVVISLVLWGRGVFCGWLCPFGALQEMLNKLALKLRVPQVAIRGALHRRLWLVKYAVAAVVFGLAIFSLPAAMVASEVEPFKTVMTAKFERSWPYVAYALALLFAGLFVERFFCRYLCPLGAALAVGGKLRRLNPLKRRAECGSPCQLCARRCPIDAIEPSGRINMTECFYCLDCQVLYDDEHVCPPLVADRKRRARAEALGQPSPNPAVA